MKPLILILTAGLLIVSCKYKQQDKVDTDEIAAPSAEKEIVRDNLQVERPAANPKVIEEEPSTVVIDPNLLQGTWKSLDDPKSSIAFIDDIIIDAYEGSHTDAGSTFVLADACQNETENTPQAEANRYITVKDKEQCFYIILLTPQSLELSYLGRGNTLKYKRAPALQ